MIRQDENFVDMIAGEGKGKSKGKCKRGFVYRFVVNTPL